MPGFQAGAPKDLQSAAGETAEQELSEDRWPLPGEGRAPTGQLRHTQQSADLSGSWSLGAPSTATHASQSRSADSQTTLQTNTTSHAGQTSLAAPSAMPVQKQPGPAGSRPQSAAEQSLLMVEAHKSRLDAMSGLLRCLACGKALSNYAVLAQHLRDKHNRINSPAPLHKQLQHQQQSEAEHGAVSMRDKGPLTLGNVMQVKQSAPAARVSSSAQTRRELKFSSKQLNQVRGLLKAHPTKEALAAALKQRMGTSTHRPSRLKRIILRERMDKSTAQATAHASSMDSFAASLRAEYQDLLRQLQESDALSRAQGDQVGSSGADDAAHTQLLQAIAQMQYQLKAAERAAEEAEGHAKALLHDHTKVTLPDQRELDQDSEPDEPQHSAHQSAAVRQPTVPAASQGGTFNTTRQATAAHAEPAAHGHAFQGASAAAEAHAQASESATELSESDSDVESLASFEDVLATWLHASQEQSPHYLSRDQLGENWAADADRFAAEEAGAAARALSAALPTAAVEETSAAEEDSESEISPEGWNNVLAAWMEASGITQSADSAEAGLTIHTVQQLDTHTYAPGMPAMSSPATHPSSPRGFATGTALPLHSTGVADSRLGLHSQPAEPSALSSAGITWQQQQGNMPGQPVLSILPQAQLLVSDSLPVMAQPASDRSAQALLSRLQPSSGMLSPFAVRQAGVPEASAASWLPGQEVLSEAEQHGSHRHSADAADGSVQWRNQSWPLHQQAAMQPLPLQPGSTYSAPAVPTVPAQRYMPLRHHAHAQEQPPPPPSRQRDLSFGKSGTGGGIDPQLLDPTLGAYPPQSDMSALRLGSLPGDAALAGMPALGPPRRLSADLPASRRLLQAMGQAGTPDWLDEGQRASSLLNPRSQQFIPHHQQQHHQQQMQPDQLYPADAQPLGMSHLFPRQANTFPPTSMRRQELWQQAALSNLALQSGQLDAVLDSANAGVAGYPLHDMHAAQQHLLQDSQLRQGMGQDLALDMSLGSGLITPSPGGHELHCQVCGVTCCGAANYEQHCLSRRHQRKMATAASANFRAAGEFPPNPAGFVNLTAPAGASGEAVSSTTYVGPQAQCRNYCQQVISTELNRVVGDLLQQLLFWQERQKAHAPLKMKKRLVSGLREVAKAVRMRKVQTVIVAPNIEQIESEGGLDDLLASILAQAEQSRTPVVFALSRKKLGQVFGCRKKMSAIAVLDASGAEEMYQQMQHLALQGRLEWQSHHGQGAAEQLAGLCLQDQQQLRDSAPSMEADLQAPPMMFQTRRDGRVVSVTSGFALDFARSKGMFLPVHGPQ